MAAIGAFAALFTRGFRLAAEAPVPLLSSITALLATLLTAIGLRAVLERGESRSLPLDPASIAIPIAYVAGAAVLFVATRVG